MKRVLLTGGAGFIGHHTIEHFLKRTDWQIFVMDRLTYAGNLNFLADLDVWKKQGHRVKFIYHDFRAPISDTTCNLMGDLDYIIHMGAESHVDRSIDDPMPFAESNVIGTVNMLQLLRFKYPHARFVYVSTDEVYGPALGGHLHAEGEPHRPSNPYSASKSGAEAFCYAYWNTYGLDIMITNTMNNFGERQNKEKFVAKTVYRLLNKEPMVAHCKREKDGVVTDVSSRCWLHARNHADGLLFVLEHGKSGERYNITGEWKPVDEMIKMIAGYLEVTDYKVLYEDFHSFRPGHDMHYGLDGSKLNALGWVAPFSLQESLENTVVWMKEHPEWL